MKEATVYECSVCGKISKTKGVITKCENAHEKEKNAVFEKLSKIEKINKFKDDLRKTATSVDEICDRVVAFSKEIDSSNYITKLTISGLRFNSANPDSEIGFYFNFKIEGVGNTFVSDLFRKYVVDIRCGGGGINSYGGSAVFYKDKWSCLFTGYQASLHASDTLSKESLVYSKLIQEKCENDGIIKTLLGVHDELLKEKMAIEARMDATREAINNHADETISKPIIEEYHRKYSKEIEDINYDFGHSISSPKMYSFNGRY